MTDTHKRRNLLLAPFRAVSSVVTFGSEFLTNPDSMGSVVPSAPPLGRRMASFIPEDEPGYVVELGAGTGVITEALLRRGIPAERLISVDACPSMTRLLRERHPAVNVVSGNAACLREILDDHVDLEREPVKYIVSGLPLRSLPKTEVNRIAEEIRQILPPDGRFIQFTYDLRVRGNPALEPMRLVDSSLVCLNLPPARVVVYGK